MASLASRFASFCFSDSRRSWNFLPLRHGQFAFGDAVPEVNLGRDDGHALLLGLNEQAVQFAPVEQQLPFPKGIVVPEASGQILGNVAVYQPSLAKANLGVGLPEGAFAFAQRFDLRAHQYQASFQTVQEVVVVGGGAILRNNLYALVLRLLWVRFHVAAIIARITGTAHKAPQVMDSDGFPALSVGFYKSLTHGGLEIRYFIRLTQLCGFVAASHCGC